MLEKQMYRTVGWIYQCKRLLDMKYGERNFTRFMMGYYDGRNLTGVEIGVFKGYNALNMLKVLSIDTLYLVDPYKVYVQDGETIDYSGGYEIAKKRLLKYQDKTQFVKRDSKDAVDFIPDNLDFVYIDGNHGYDFVKKDIELYYPKVRSGGVLGGHNFDYTSVGLMKAVIDFTDKNDLDLVGDETDWWIIKEDEQ